MISCEATGEGFTLSFDGRRLLSHSRRSPCIEIGRSEGIPRLPRGAEAPRRTRARSLPLRSFAVVESSPERLVVDFESRLRMTLAAEGGGLSISFSASEPGCNLFRLRLAAWPDEAVFGCGDARSLRRGGAARGARLDRKLSLVPLWVRDSGAIGETGRRLSRPRGGSSSLPVAAFVSSRGCWCAVDTSAFLRFDFRRRSTTLIEAQALPREVILGFREGGAELVSDLSAALGRQSAPPAWCRAGACLGLSGGADKVEEALDTALAAGIAVSSVMIEDWSGPREPRTGLPPDWQRDGKLYPDLAGLAARLRARGVRCLGSIAPLLPDSGALLAEAAAAGILVKDGAGADCVLKAGARGVGLVDLSSDAGAAWMKSLIARELAGAGMSGWAADCGEQLPLGAVAASGEEAVRAHNRWPLLWAQACREAAWESGRGSEMFCFLRSGWLGAAPFAGGVHAGERATSFSRRDGLPSLLPAALSLGMSGFGFWHAEIGGSLAPGFLERSRPGFRARRAECLARWMELSAFTSFFRIAFRPGDPDFGPRNLALLGRMSALYAALEPYHSAAAAECASTGLPPMRHPWLHYGADPETRGLERQYLYGRDLMVAPTLAPGASLTDLYLPDDEWVHLWTSRRFRGGRVSIETPLGCPAVFYRADSGFAQLFDGLRRTLSRH